jgi:hypothetical protein
VGGTPSPVQGAGVYAALNRAADTTVDNRSRGAVMADTLVERVTCRPAGTPEPVAVNLVISDETLLGGDNTPAVVEGYGPIPAMWRAAWSMRRSPMTGLGPPCAALSAPKVGGVGGDGIIITMLPARAVPFIGLRDLTCRTPYCDAPIRHRDHAQPRNRGGPTSARNGLGMCERCNYAKEVPGWHVCAGDENGVHTAEFTTPTGMRHHSTAPPPPGPPPIAVSEIETRIGIAIAQHAA